MQFTKWHDTLRQSLARAVQAAQGQASWHRESHFFTGYRYWVSCPQWFINLCGALVFVRWFLVYAWSAFTSQFVVHG